MISYKKFIDENISIKRHLEKYLHKFELISESCWVDFKPAIKIKLFNDDEQILNILKTSLSDKYIMYTEEDYYIVKRI